LKECVNRSIDVSSNSKQRFQYHHRFLERKTKAPLLQRCAEIGGKHNLKVIFHINSRSGVKNLQFIAMPTVCLFFIMMTNDLQCW